MQKTLSLCMIVRDCSRIIERALSSIVDQIDEAVIVDTGSEDGTQKKIEHFFRSRKKQLRLIHFTPEKHPESFLLDVAETWKGSLPGPFSGRHMLADFSAARQAGWDAATGDYKIWIDSDDVFENPDTIPKIIEQMENGKLDCGLINYDYSKDERGNVNCKLIRERIFSTERSRARWSQPIHEIIFPAMNARLFSGKPNIVHLRVQDGAPPLFHNRNLKVLTKWWMDKHSSLGSNKLDIRNLFYLGMEERRDFPDKALEHLGKYAEKSAWDEERALAYLLMGETYERKEMFDEAYNAYALATLDFPSSPDGFLGLARAAFFKKNWPRCVEFTERAVKSTQQHKQHVQVLMHDPAARTWKPHVYYSRALMELNKPEEALEACKRGLAIAPDEPNLLANKKACEEYIAAKSKVKDDGSASSFKVDFDEPIDSPPKEIPPDVMEAFAIEMWKENVAAKNTVRALQLLEALPASIFMGRKVSEARQKTLESLPKEEHHTQIEKTDGIPTAKPVQTMTMSPSLKFTTDEPLETRSLPMPDDLIKAFALEIWKKISEEGDHAKALKLLDSLPARFARDSKIERARAMSQDRLMVRKSAAGRKEVEGEEIPTLVTPAATSPTTLTTPATTPATHTAPATTPTTKQEKLKIIIWTGPAWERWSPESLDKGGIAGSETAAICMARELARRGHDITALADCAGKEGTYDGVKYVHFQDALNNPSTFRSDVFVCSRQPSAFEFPFEWKASFLWVHDVHVGMPTTGRLHDQICKATKIFCLSKWHKQFFLDAYPFLPEDKIIVTRNGIDLKYFEKEPRKEGNRLIYSSSPDRGLERLLELLPEIRKKVPDATLDVYYGFENWKKMAQQNGGPTERERVERFEKALEDLTKAGALRYHGRVSKQELADAFLTSKVWAYPTWFTESFCQLPGSLVFTKEGMKPIEEIREGDLVLTHKGRFRRVTHTIKKQYDGTVYSIKRRKDFNPITVTSEHPIYVATFHKRSDAQGNRIYSEEHKKVTWIPPGEMKEELCYLISPRMQFGNKASILLSDYIDLPVLDGKLSSNHNHPRYSKVENEIPITEEFAYILGIFAAEGCVSRTRSRSSKRDWMSQIIFALHIREKTITDKIIKFFGKGTIRQTSENGITIATSNSVWANFLDSVIGRKRDKKIPDFIWDCPAEIQAAFVNGLFDGDGSKSKTPRGNAGTTKPYFHYTTISPSLAYGMAQLLANQGFYPGIVYSKNRRAYTLNWTSPPGPSVQHHEIEEGYVTRIKSIQKTEYSGFVYNFDVEEDESYVTDRTIVHNCITAIEAQAAGCVPVVTALAALTETVSHGFAISPPNTSMDYARVFINRVVKLLVKDEERQRYASAGRKYAFLNHGWDGVAEEWEKIFYRELIGKPIEKNENFTSGKNFFSHLLNKNF